MRSEALLLYGTDALPAVERSCASGDFTFVLCEGVMRDLRWRGVEVLRGLDYPIRDADWATKPIRETASSLKENADTVAYRRSFMSADDALAGDFDLMVKTDGSVSACIRLTARREIEVNRAGFVVLHPLDGVAGSTMTITDVNGEMSEISLTRSVMPHQPARNITGIAHEIGKVQVVYSFSGEIFEMEDQRNWTDASFKTYCRPLDAPRPFLLRQGEMIEQRILLTVRGGDSAQGPQPRQQVRFGSRDGAVMPEWGLALEPGWTPEANEASALADLSPSFTTLRLYTGDLPDNARFHALLDACAETLALELVVEETREELRRKLERIAAVVERSGRVVARVVALPKPYMATLDAGEVPAGLSPAEALGMVREVFPGAEAGGGVLTNFTELNRLPIAAEGADFVTFSSSAIVHAADDRSVMETLEALPFVVETAREIAGGRPLRLGLVGIGMRTNPYGADCATNPERVRLAMVRHDPRQNALFAAAWTVGAASRLSRTVASASLAAPSGPFGLVKGTSKGAEIYPLYHVVKWLAACSGRPLRTVLAPAGVAALATDDAFIMANLGVMPRRIDLDRPALTTMLDLESVEDAIRDPQWMSRVPFVANQGSLLLGPYAVVFGRLDDGKAMP